MTDYEKINMAQIAEKEMENGLMKGILTVAAGILLAAFLLWLVLAHHSPNPLMAFWGLVIVIGVFGIVFVLLFSLVLWALDRYKPL